MSADLVDSLRAAVSHLEEAIQPVSTRSPSVEEALSAFDECQASATAAAAMDASVDVTAEIGLVGAGLTELGTLGAALLGARGSVEETAALLLVRAHSGAGSRAEERAETMRAVLNAVAAFHESGDVTRLRSFPSELGPLFGGDADELVDAIERLASADESFHDAKMVLLMATDTLHRALPTPENAEQ